MRTKPTKRERFTPHAARIIGKVYGLPRNASPMQVVKRYLGGYRYSTRSNVECQSHRGQWSTDLRPWNPSPWVKREHRWREDEREALRAKHDPAFRKSWNARTLRVLRAWQAKYPGLEGHWSIENGLSPQEAQVKRLIHLRGIAGLSTDFIPEVHTIPISIQTARDLGIKLVQRGKDWDVAPTDRRVTWYQHKDGYHSGPITKRGTYERAVNITHVPSVATVLDPLTIDCLIGTVRKTVTVSAPISWQVDALGLHVKCGVHDYHPDAADLLRDDVEFYLASKLIDKAWVARRPVDWQGVEIPIDQVFVCFKDSVKAGNCPAGTKTWAITHKVDPKKHVRADVLLRLGRTDTRVQKTIVTAANRCVAEVKRGYSILAEHKA